MDANAKTPTVTDLREERRALRLQLEVHKLRQTNKLLESFWQDDDFGGVDLWSRIRQRDDSGRWVPIANTSDRRHGANWPLWRTEVELGDLRQKSRIASETNSYAKGLTKNYLNYVIGKGYTYSCSSKELIDTDPDKPGTQEADGIKSLVAQVQDIVDEFLSLNRWNSSVDPFGSLVVTASREREAAKRVLRDGEAFIRFFFDEGQGVTLVRFVEPEQIRQPPNGNERDGWSFGIRHQMAPFEDVEAYEAYWVAYQDATLGDGQSGEEVPADQILHLKGPDTDASLKRGTPAFAYDTLSAFERAGKLQRNVSIGSAIRAAVAETHQYTTGTQAQIQALAGQFATLTVSDPVTGQTRNIENIPPGTIRRIPAGQEITGPPESTATTQQLEAAQGDLRQGSAAFNAPEYWTGDSSNGNYSSLETASAPAVKMGETEQEYYRSANLCVVWQAVKWAVKCGRLDARALTLVDIQAEPQMVLHRNILETAQADQILVTIGAKSPQTCGAERGLDPEIEQANIQQYHERLGSGGTPLATDAEGGEPPANPFSGTEGTDELVLLNVPDFRQEMPWSCGAAALRSVLAFFGESWSEAQCRQVLGTNEQEGTRPDALEGAVTGAGLRCLHVTATPWEVQRLRAVLDGGRTVFIAAIQAYGTPDEYAAKRSGHYVVVIGYQGNDLILQDPVAGRIQMPADEFERRWHDRDAAGNELNHWAMAVWRE